MNLCGVHPPDNKTQAFFRADGCDHRLREEAGKEFPRYCRRILMCLNYLRKIPQRIFE